MKKAVNTYNRSAALALKIVGSIIIVKILKFHSNPTQLDS